MGIYTECHVTSHQTIRLNPFCYKDEIKVTWSVSAHVLAAGGCRASLSEAPIDPLQDTAGKGVHKKVQNTAWQRGEKCKKTTLQAFHIGEGIPGTPAGIPCRPCWSKNCPAAHGETTTQQISTPAACGGPQAGAGLSWRTWSLCGEDPHRSRGKSTQRKECQREAVTDWPQPPFPTSCAVWGRRKTEVKNEGTESGIK